MTKFHKTTTSKIYYPLESRRVKGGFLLPVLAACLGHVAVADEFPKPIFEVPLPSNPEFVATDSRNAERVIYSESHALLIAEESYVKWRKLSGIKKEVLRLASALEKDQFHVVAYLDLEGKDLFTVIEQFIKDYGYVKQSRILILVTGHGYALQDYLEDNALSENSRTVGYFVPIDAPKPDQDEDGFIKRSLRLSQFKEWAGAMQAKHSLMIFDACTSGAIFEGTKGLPEEKPADTKWAIFEERKNQRTRMFLTAGTDKQYVPENSRFMQLLTEAYLGLRQLEKADYNEDGFLTGKELANFLEGWVPQFTDTTPLSGHIRDSDLDKGDFIFRLLKDTSSVTVNEGATGTVGFKAISIQEPSRQAPLAFSSKVEQLARADVRCNGPCTRQSALEQKMSIEIPQKAPLEAVLRNVSLTCLTGKCDQSMVTSPIALSANGRKATVRFKAWSADTIWALSGDVAVPSASPVKGVPFKEHQPARLTSNLPGSPVHAKVLTNLDQLESDNKAMRYAARNELAESLNDLTPNDIAEIVRALPNSSYRKALGVAVALGAAPNDWKSSEPEVSKSILSTLAERSSDKTLGEAIGKALENSAYMEIAAECTTKATGLDGARNACDSEITTLTAPQGYAFVKETLQGGEISGNGSEHECHVNWQDNVAVIPGTQKTLHGVVTLQAHARSPQGHFSGRGWAKCTYIVEISKDSNLSK